MSMKEIERWGERECREWIERGEERRRGQELRRGTEKNSTERRGEERRGEEKRRRT